jgi:YidC/Oxa1 family membrane protein insertase
VDRNLLLAIVLSLAVLMSWSAWERARRGEQPPVDITAPEQVEAPRPSRVTGAQPATKPAEPPRGRLSPRGDSVTSRDEPNAPETRAHVTTDLFTAELSSHGGTLAHWELAHYVDKSVPGAPLVVLTTPETAGDAELVTPFLGLGQGDLSRAAYELEQPSPLEVVFRREAGGVVTTKAYEFSPESYAFRLRLEVENRSSETIESSFDLGWRASHRDGPDFVDQGLLALHDGSLERVRLDAFGKGGFFGGGGAEPKKMSGNVDWAGVELRYFLAAFLPEAARDASASFIPIEPGTAAEVQIGYAPIEIPPGQSASREYRGYIGPKERDRLVALGAHVDRAADQGWSWMSPLTAFFSWTLQLCYAVIPNYGVAIIVLTILVRLVTAPLTARQMRSMKRMGELQPKLKEIQEKFKDDRQRQSQEMMRIYRETGVNPLGGCLPLLLQFPVFIGLYYALQSSIDLRQAPFFGWIDDLSRPETLFTLPGVDLPVRVLPLVMGGTMVLQQRMTPTTMDPQQARMMMTVMPVMFTVLFYQFPSGLVLYWMVSNLLAIGHQAWVNRQKSA